MRLMPTIALFAACFIAFPTVVADDHENDFGALQGTWEVVEAHVNGRDRTEEFEGHFTITFKGHTMQVPAGGGKANDLSITLDPTKKPKSMKLVRTTAGPNKGETLLAIYDLESGGLRLCMQNRPNDKEPIEFSSAEGSGLAFFRFRRAAIAAKQSEDRSPADELPEDTNKIASLTPDLATRLVERAAKGKVNEERGEKVIHHTGLFLDGLTSLDAETAKALTGYRQGPLTLNGLSTLDAEVARVLAEAKASSISLDGVTTLDADAAMAIAKRKKGNLFLGGLTTLDAEAAKALGEFKGQGLSLSGLSKLDAATAKALAAAKKWDGALPSLRTLDSPDSVAIAHALAARKGPLFLPKLKKISPKTLTALLEKEDIQIPLIETLELIPEPDGSVTEDFVIPKDFEKRKQLQRQ